MDFVTNISGIQISFRRFLLKIGHLLWKNRTLCFFRSIAHRLPLLFPIFLAAYKYHVGRMFHILRLSTNRPNFWYFRKYLNFDQELSLVYCKNVNGFINKLNPGVYSLFHKKRYAFTRKFLKKTSFLFFGTTVRIKH